MKPLHETPLVKTIFFFLNVNNARHDSEKTQVSTEQNQRLH